MMSEAPSSTTTPVSPLSDFSYLLGDFLGDAQARSGAGGEFVIDTSAYRQAYRDFYAEYEVVRTYRERIEAQAAQWNPSAASTQITGVASALQAATAASGSRDIGSLTSEVLATESRMAAYLNAMRKAFVAYMQGDSLGMQALVAASAE